MPEGAEGAPQSEGCAAGPMEVRAAEAVARLPKPRRRSAAWSAESSARCCCQDHLSEARALEGMAAGSLARASQPWGSRRGTPSAARRAGVARRSGLAASEGDGEARARWVPVEKAAAGVGAGTAAAAESGAGGGRWGVVELGSSAVADRSAARRGGDGWLPPG